MHAFFFGSLSWASCCTCRCSWDLGPAGPTVAGNRDICGNAGCTRDSWFVVRAPRCIAYVSRRGLRLIAALRLTGWRLRPQRSIKERVQGQAAPSLTSLEHDATAPGRMNCALWTMLDGLSIGRARCSQLTPLARRVSHARESSGLCTFPLNSGTESASKPPRTTTL